jgi:hypothetical protein
VNFGFVKGLLTSAMATSRIVVLPAMTGALAGGAPFIEAVIHTDTQRVVSVQVAGDKT